MARSDDYRAASQLAKDMENFVRAEAENVATLDLDGGVVAAAIGNEIRSMMENILDGGRTIVDAADALIELLEGRMRMCERYERELEIWERNTADWFSRQRSFANDPVLNRPPGAKPVRPQPPGPWAE